MDAEIEKKGVTKAKGKIEKERRRKEARRKGAEERREKEKTKKEESDRIKEDSREMGDLGQRRGSSEVWKRSQEIGSSKFP